MASRQQEPFFVEAVLRAFAESNRVLQPLPNTFTSTANTGNKTTATKTITMGLESERPLGEADMGMLSFTPIAASSSLSPLPSNSPLFSTLALKNGKRPGKDATEGSASWALLSNPSATLMRQHSPLTAAFASSPASYSPIFTLSVRRGVTTLASGDDSYQKVLAAPFIDPCSLVSAALLEEKAQRDLKAQRKQERKRQRRLEATVEKGGESQFEEEGGTPQKKGQVENENENKKVVVAAGVGGLNKDLGPKEAFRDVKTAKASSFDLSCPMTALERLFTLLSTERTNTLLTSADGGLVSLPAAGSDFALHTGRVEEREGAAAVSNEAKEPIDSASTKKGSRTVSSSGAATRNQQQDKRQDALKKRGSSSGGRERRGGDGVKPAAVSVVPHLSPSPSAAALDGSIVNDSQQRLLRGMLQNPPLLSEVMPELSSANRKNPSMGSETRDLIDVTGGYNINNSVGTSNDVKKKGGGLASASSLPLPLPLKGKSVSGGVGAGRPSADIPLLALSSLNNNNNNNSFASSVPQLVDSGNSPLVRGGRGEGGSGVSLSKSSRAVSLSSPWPPLPQRPAERQPKSPRSMTPRSRHLPPPLFGESTRSASSHSITVLFNNTNNTDGGDNDSFTRYENNNNINKNSSTTHLSPNASVTTPRRLLSIGSAGTNLGVGTDVGNRGGSGRVSRTTSAAAVATAPSNLRLTPPLTPTVTMRIPPLSTFSFSSAAAATPTLISSPAKKNAKLMNSVTTSRSQTTCETVDPPFVDSLRLAEYLDKVSIGSAWADIDMLHKKKTIPTSASASVGGGAGGLGSVFYRMLERDLSLLVGVERRKREMALEAEESLVRKQEIEEALHGKTFFSLDGRGGPTTTGTVKDNNGEASDAAEDLIEVATVIKRLVLADDADDTTKVITIVHVKPPPLSPPPHSPNSLRRSASRVSNTSSRVTQAGTAALATTAAAASASKGNTNRVGGVGARRSNNPLLPLPASTSPSRLGLGTQKNSTMSPRSNTNTNTLNDSGNIRVEMSGEGNTAPHRPLRQEEHLFLKPRPQPISETSVFAARKLQSLEYLTKLFALREAELERKRLARERDRERRERERARRERERSKKNPKIVVGRSLRKAKEEVIEGSDRDDEDVDDAFKSALLDVNAGHSPPAPELAKKSPHSLSPNLLWAANTHVAARDREPLPSLDGYFTANPPSTKGRRRRLTKSGHRGGTPYHVHIIPTEEAVEESKSGGREVEGAKGPFSSATSVLIPYDSPEPLTTRKGKGTVPPSLALLGECVLIICDIVRSDPIAKQEQEAELKEAEKREEERLSTERAKRERERERQRRQKREGDDADNFDNTNTATNKGEGTALETSICMPYVFPIEDTTASSTSHETRRNNVLKSTIVGGAAVVMKEGDKAIMSNTNNAFLSQNKRKSRSETAVAANAGDLGESAAINIDNAVMLERSGVSDDDGFNPLPNPIQGTWSVVWGERVRKRAARRLRQRGEGEKRRRRRSTRVLSVPSSRGSSIVEGGDTHEAKNESRKGSAIRAEPKRGQSEDRSKAGSPITMPNKEKEKDRSGDKDDRSKDGVSSVPLSLPIYSTTTSRTGANAAIKTSEHRTHQLLYRNISCLNVSDIVDVSVQMGAWPAVTLKPSAEEERTAETSPFSFMSRARSKSQSSAQIGRDSSPARTAAGASPIRQSGTSTPHQPSPSNRKPKPKLEHASPTDKSDAKMRTDNLGPPGGIGGGGEDTDGPANTLLLSALRQTSSLFAPMGQSAAVVKVASRQPPPFLQRRVVDIVHCVPRALAPLSTYIEGDTAASQSKNDVEKEKGLRRNDKRRSRENEGNGSNAKRRESLSSSSSSSGSSSEPSASRARSRGKNALTSTLLAPSVSVPGAHAHISVESEREWYESRALSEVSRNEEILLLEKAKAHLFTKGKKLSSAAADRLDKLSVVRDLKYLADISEIFSPELGPNLLLHDGPATAGGKGRGALLLRQRQQKERGGGGGGRLSVSNEGGTLWSSVSSSLNGGPTTAAVHVAGKSPGSTREFVNGKDALAPALLGASTFLKRGGFDGDFQGEATATERVDKLIASIVPPVIAPCNKYSVANENTPIIRISRDEEEKKGNSSSAPRRFGSRTPAQSPRPMPDRDEGEKARGGKRGSAQLPSQEERNF